MAACTLTQTAFFFSLSSTKIILTGFFVCFCGVFFVCLMVKQVLENKPYCCFPNPQGAEPVVWKAGVTKDWMVKPQGLASTKGWLNHNKNKTFFAQEP